MEFFNKRTTIDFMSLRWYAYVFSFILISGSIYVWFAKGDAKYGTDYRGGHEITVKFQTETTSDALRDILSKHGFEDAIVQSFEAGSNDYVIRLGDPAKAKVVKEKVQLALNIAFQGKYEIIKTDYVGPTASVELRRKGLLAVSMGLVGILAYVSLRFQLSFAIGAVIALFHDVIVSVGVYLLAGHSLSGSALAAALTIVGYSVNDTIVIFDRVREEILGRKNFDLAALLNDSINMMLPRTMITHMLTFFSALSLFLFGGGAISDLTLFLLIGIVSGSYSTIFIAAPVVMICEGFRSKKAAATA